LAVNLLIHRGAVYKSTSVCVLSLVKFINILECCTFSVACSHSIASAVREQWLPNGRQHRSSQSEFAMSVRYVFRCQLCLSWHGCCVICHTCLSVPSPFT